MREILQIAANLITNRSKGQEAFFFETLYTRWVWKALMKPVRVSRKNRAAFFGVVTNRQNVIELLVAELINALGPVAGNINAEFFHYGYRFRANFARPCAGALDFEPISGVMSEETFSHLAPR